MANNCLTDEDIKKFGFEGKTTEEILDELRDSSNSMKLSIRQAKIEAIVYSKAHGIVMNYKDKNGKKNAKQGLKSFVYRDRTEQSRINPDGTGQGADLDSTIHSVNAFYQRKIQPIMEELMPKIFGTVSNKEAGRNIVRAIWGDAPSPEYKKLADTWKSVVEELRGRFNKAGGDINKLGDWNLPQVHDPFLVAKGGYEKWVVKIKETADLEKMGVTGKDSDRILREVYDDIASDGVNKAENAGIYGESKVANRYQERRFIKFKDAEGWIKYNEEYSNAGAYNAMTDYMTMLSNDIALMENLGPNPGRAFDSLANAVDAAQGRNAGDSARKAFANISGRTNPNNRRVSDITSSIRNYTVATKLPMAVVSAPADVITNSMAANYNGFSGMDVVLDTMKILSQATDSLGAAKNRKLAGELMMQLDFMVDVAHSAQRYSDVVGQGFSAKLAGFVLKAGGLNHWTVANKMGFHFNFMKALAKPDVLNSPQMKASFARYGIDENDISEIRKSKSMKRGGSNFLDPDELSPATAQKVSAMIIAETKLAVPEADAGAKGLLNQGSRKGEAGGEALRFITMFKTFPTSIIMGNWARVLHGNGLNAGGRVGNAMNLLIGTTIMGAMSLQLKQIIKDEEQLPWDSNKFWRDASIQGGGFSILGDLFSKEMRDYGSMADFIGGPAVGMVDDIVWKGILGDYDDAIHTDKTLTEMFKGAVGESAKYVPGQFFYTKTIMNRFFLDEMKRFGNPRYDVKKAQRYNKKMREYDEERW